MSFIRAKTQSPDADISEQGVPLTSADDVIKVSAPDNVTREYLRIFHMYEVIRWSQLADMNPEGLLSWFRNISNQPTQDVVREWITLGGFMRQIVTELPDFPMVPSDSSSDKDLGGHPIDDDNAWSELGILPYMVELLHNEGIATYEQLASSDVQTLGNSLKGYLNNPNNISIWVQKAQSYLKQ